MHVHSLICFGARPGEGNPALVVEGDGMDLDARQRFAAERHTTCVFLAAPDTDGVHEIDYFYPHTLMRDEVCSVCM